MPLDMSKEIFLRNSGPLSLPLPRESTSKASWKFREEYRRAYPTRWLRRASTIRLSVPPTRLTFNAQFNT
jgi:hypothetical protein